MRHSMDMEPPSVGGGNASLHVLVFKEQQSEYLADLLRKERDDPECFNNIKFQRAAYTLAARRKGVPCASVSWLVQCLITQTTAPLDSFLARVPPEAS